MLYANLSDTKSKRDEEWGYQNALFPDMERVLKSTICASLATAPILMIDGAFLTNWAFSTVKSMLKPFAVPEISILSILNLTTPVSLFMLFYMSARFCIAVS